jgi:Putative Ig domain
MQMNFHCLISRCALYRTLLGIALISAFLPLTVDAQDRQPAQSSAPEEPGLTISDHPLPPDAYIQTRYYFQFETHGNTVPPVHWRVDNGTLPPGLKLEANGVLHGEATRPGEYGFTLSVTDSSVPPQAVQRHFIIKIINALVLTWKDPAHVSGSRIEGSVLVTNTTADDIDLTFIVEAVAPNGRATAIGYQHFVLPKATVEKELPFGENLPSGDYLVNVDAIGEVARRNAIFRERMQTPRPLRVAVGP